MVITEEKIDVIFSRLLTYVEKKFKSFLCKESLFQIKDLLTQTLKDKNKVKSFEEIGLFFAESDVIFVEAVSLFDFLRKNFIAHLPNNVDLREAKRVERLFEDIVNSFSKGYVESYTKREINNLTFLENHIIPSEMIYQLSRPLKSHIEYLRNFLYSIITDRDFDSVDYKSCEFRIWLKEEGKQLIEEEIIFKNIKFLHKNFHNLIEIAQSYKNQGFYKELFFILNEIENILLQNINNFSYLNTKLLALEFAKDPLTGVSTRRGFNVILQKHFEISELTRLPISIIIADIDFFKKINDTYGHLAGDEALKHFVKIIKQNLRKSDYIFRFGGEEFIILLPNTTLEEAIVIAEKIRETLEKTPLIYNGKEIKITASFGVKEVHPGEPVDRIIEDVDKKLYKAKESGRNKVIY
ncbi:ggdef domain protein [Sulfurihydrogenibium azorense Az-Fu1]|uniref:diguanylate cyclase n=1 Tax=Sulfurihydrogenibium azorense (strain DSM 15241 / OCM 825 / Az-Fu1) TaxID=204536 RepID=C1DXM6_SULAA|nr:sensor domain-containing diguanylate cyclase [Sulfurihydrogenibium azorense]ACN99608.1 ggdef domain protein [Sulfurihydrogenibium azorense Az-Fu1]